MYTSENGTTLYHRTLEGLVKSQTAAMAKGDLSNGTEQEIYNRGNKEPLDEKLQD
jgi:hypothetical protein